MLREKLVKYLLFTAEEESDDVGFLQKKKKGEHPKLMCFLFSLKISHTSNQHKEKCRSRQTRTRS